MSKIVCTIGPSSRPRNILDHMKAQGMDVARLNLGHGNLDEHREVVKSIREMGEVAVLVDLPGPRIRLGTLEDKVTLDPGANIHFTTKNVVGSSRILPVTYEKLPEEVSIGNSIFINDGIVEIKVTGIEEDGKGFNGLVISGGEVATNKGVNVPEAALSMRPPTIKDIEGVRFGVEMDADWFAASFIREAGDIYRMRKAIAEAGGDQPIIAKVEHGDAVKNIEELIEASDAVMVARGDLGIEIPPWEVPMIQKRIIRLCNTAGKPVIVATQMLESMSINPRPTRAEANDVANAILDGADAVMLSGETATGLYPIEAVRTMNQISRAAENVMVPHSDLGLRKNNGLSLPDVIGDLVSRAVRVVKPTAVIVVTRSGFSALMISKYRPATRILAVCKDERVRRRMHLYWGVKPLDAGWTENRDELIVRAMRIGLEKGLFKKEDAVMVVSGSTLIAPGSTSTLDILSVKDVLSNTKSCD